MEDFVHESWCEGDDHCVTPRLAKGPHYDHPDCPSKISMFDFDFFENGMSPVAEHVPDKWQDFSLELFLTDCRIKCPVFKDKLSLLGQAVIPNLQKPIISILTITFLETLGCCSGRSVARANQRKHLIPKITNQNNGSIKKWFRIPSQREERNWVEHHLKKNSIK